MSALLLGIQPSGPVSCSFTKVVIDNISVHETSRLTCSGIGPFKPSILRFQISFPHGYPSLPPLITFSTEIFHPLLTPLTTYTYTTSAASTETVSASDQERLPPGGFSLRHGFPEWFAASQRDPTQAKQSIRPSTSILEVLDYIRYAFNEEACLDSIPLDAAANPGAYHAWQSHRTRQMQSSRAASPQSASLSQRSGGMENISSALNTNRDSTAAGRGRRPGQWNWEGVWDERVKRGIQSSLAEQVLFGGANAPDELIRFANLDPSTVEEIMHELRQNEEQLP
jgi:hypothetical protein